MSNKCPICGKEVIKRIPVNHPYYGFLCEACDLLITDVEGVNFENLNESVYVLEDRIKTYYQREREFKRRYKSFFEYVKKYNGDIKNVLEIGSNIGFLANFLSGVGLKVTTVEINSELLNFQKQVYGIEGYDNIGSLPDDAKYDLIIFMDVIEHIDNFMSFLFSIKKYLNKGGLIFFQFPNKNSLIAKIIKQKWNWWCAPDHLHHFSTQACRRLSDKLMMKVVDIRCYSPALDDLSALPLIGLLPKVLRKFNEIFPLNIPVYFKAGSLIQLIITDDKSNK